MGTPRTRHYRREGIGVALLAIACASGGLAPTAIAGGPPPAPDRVFREGGLKYVMTRATSGSSTDFATVQVPCRGKRWRVVGGGADLVEGFAPAVYLIRSHPFDFNQAHGGDNDQKPDDGWDVLVREEAGPDLVVKVWAICAKRAGLRYRSGTAAPGPGEGGTATASCRGDQVLGGGFSTVPVQVTEASVASPFDGGDRGARPDDGWTVNGFNHSAPAATVRADAICSSKGGARYRTKAATEVPAPATQSPRARCRRGSHVTGGGGSVASGHFVESHPVDGGDRGRAPDDGWQTTLVVGTGFAARTDAVCRR